MPVKRDPLNRARVLEEAVALADAEGIAALSMRKLAQRLGVEAMSLYHHVAGKDQVLMGMCDVVVASIRHPRAGGDWKAEMRARAVSAHQVMLRHRWLPMLMVSLPNTGAPVLGYVEATLACLAGAGFSLPQADRAWNAMDSHIIGFTLQKINFPFTPDDYARAAAEYMPMIPADAMPQLLALTRLVATHQHDGLHDLMFGMDLLLDGLERMRDA